MCMCMCMYRSQWLVPVPLGVYEGRELSVEPDLLGEAHDTELQQTVADKQPCKEGQNKPNLIQFHWTVMEK